MTDRQTRRAAPSVLPDESSSRDGQDERGYHTHGAGEHDATDYAPAPARRAYVRNIDCSPCTSPAEPDLARGGRHR